MTTRYLPESEVLLPRDPAVTNTDKWPIFELHEASVSLSGGEPTDFVSLLLAHEHHPLRVTGRLENPPPDRQCHLWQPAYRVASDNSLGASKRRRAQDALVELEPVRYFAYGTNSDGKVIIWAAGSAGWFELKPARTYRRVYDEMAAAVSTLYFIIDACAPGKDPPSVRALFERYSREIAGDADDAATRVYRHRDFLLSIMMGGKDGLSWTRLPIYRHLYHKFPRDVTEIKKRLTALGSRSERKSDVPFNRANRADSESSVPTSTGPKRKRQRSSIPAVPWDVPSPPPEDVSILASEDGTPRKRGRPKGSRGKSSAAVPARLSTTPANSIPPTPDDERSLATSTNMSDSDAAPARAKNKSALRLRSSKPSKGLQTTAGRRAGKGLLDNATTNDDDIENDNAGPGSPPFFHAGVRNRDNSGRYRHDVDEGIDIPASPSTESEGDPLTQPIGVPTASSADLPLDLMAAPDQLQEEVWTCALAGCAHKVYGAATMPDVQGLIREHYALHAFDDDRRVQLVNTLRAPSLPVAHLLERVKRQARSDGFPHSTVAGTRFPKF